MKVFCSNCGRDVSRFNVGKDGRPVLCDFCTMCLVSGVKDSVLKEKRPPRKTKKKKEIMRIKKIGEINEVL